MSSTRHLAASSVALVPGSTALTRRLLSASASAIARELVDAALADVVACIVGIVTTALTEHHVDDAATQGGATDACACLGAFLAYKDIDGR